MATNMFVAMITLADDGAVDVRTRSGALLGTVIDGGAGTILATRFVDPWGNTHPFGYDTDGVIVASEAAGVHWITSQR